MPKRKRDSPARTTSATAGSSASAITEKRDKDTSPVKKKRATGVDVQPVLGALNNARTTLQGANGTDTKAESIAQAIAALVGLNNDAKIRLPRAAKTDSPATKGLRAALDALKSSGAAALRDERVVAAVRALRTDMDDVDMDGTTLPGSSSPPDAAEKKYTPLPAPTPRGRQTAKSTPLEAQPQASTSKAPPAQPKSRDERAGTPIPETMMDDEQGLPLNSLRMDDDALDDEYEWDEYTVFDFMAGFIDDTWSDSELDSDELTGVDGGGYGYEYDGDAWSDEEDYYYSDDE